MRNQKENELAQKLSKLLPKLKSDESEMGQQFYETAKAYIRNSKQLYKIIEISDKNQSAIMEMSKKLEKSREELEKAKDIAEEANKSKSIFLSNMTHEIRTPLNSIIGFTDLLVNLPMGKVQKQYVENINVSAHSLLGVINDILDFSKIEAGKLELELLKEDIVKVAENSLNIIKFQADNKGLTLELETQQNMPRFAIIDALRLRQVLVNLLGNAIKFTEKGTVELKLTFNKIDGKKGVYTLSVKDTGMGITEEKRQKLFKAFSQTDVSITRKFGGTGLGLAISAMLVKKMGGNIEVESEHENGSTFFFSLLTPYFYETKKAESHEEGEPSDEIKTDKRPSTLLIAEDVNINMQLIKAIIEKYFPNSKTLEAQNGEQAYQITKTQHIDLILMDVQMPVMNGLDATKKIREDELQTDKHTPIIALTAAAVKEGIQNCLDAGMDDFLTKPIKQKLFHEKIDYFLSQRKDAKTNTKKENDDLGQIEGIDCKEGLARLSQKKDLYLSLLCEFAQQSFQDYDDLKRTLKQNTVDAITIVHRIKGVAFNLSVSGVGQAAEEIETALKNGDEDSLDAKVERLKIKIENFKASIEKYLKK
ncbi:MAG: ATP-binding protein [Thermotogota bacterium]|nr:ATP-binding protein [Thermotogota bacterium]